MTRRPPRGAIDPAVFTNFVRTRQVTLPAGSPTRARRFCNGCLMDAIDARKLRRWRSGTAVWIARDTVEEFLARYGLTLAELESWALAEGWRVYIRPKE